ncbi:TetR/AcrR family transcriptional regulator C-terminal domain-containing protein [Streptomyces sp. NPDC058612]|uniref:TetR/AcrR family transcriptional regulator C-terminal domain-containing protein n=1 Tax=Streptomyces sp. NPDC058612 TaxID=3346555 RepID=UPI003660C1B4
MDPVPGGHHASVRCDQEVRGQSPSVLRWAETLLGVLTEAGLGAEERVVALRALLAYVIGAVQQEHLGALAGPGTAAIASLPAEEYPYLAGTAETARALTPAAEFDGGLTLLLNGLRRP